MDTELDLSGLKPPLFKDDHSTPADITGSTVQCSRSSARECDRIRPGDSKPSLNDDASGMQDHPQSTTKFLPLDPADLRPPVRAVKEDWRGGVHHTQPVCTQLPASTQSPASLCPTSKSYGFQHQELHSCPSESNTPQSLQTAHGRQVAGDDPCASLVLACLFCQLKDCLVAMGEGCQVCVGGLCSALCSRACCCDPSSLEPFLEVCPSCEPTSCLHAHCCLCRGAGVDASICDFCLHATECLDLGMEISQLLFH